MKPITGRDCLAFLLERDRHECSVLIDIHGKQCVLFLSLICLLFLWKQNVSEAPLSHWSFFFAKTFCFKNVQNIKQMSKLCQFKYTRILKLISSDCSFNLLYRKPISSTFNINLPDHILFSRYHDILLRYISRFYPTRLARDLCTN